MWRRWLANEMRRLRRAAGLEQKEVADRLRCTVSKVSYVENGERSFRPRDLTEVLLPLYGVPEDRWDDYVDGCKRSRVRGWWQHYDEDVVADWFSYYVGLEQGASWLRGFELAFIPGLLQTAGYAESLTRSDPVRLTQDEIAARVEVRRKRQSALRRDADPLEVRFVLDEAVLRRVVGGPEVMHDQLVHLAALTERANVTVQVLPFTSGPHPNLTGSFTILGFPWEDTGVVYVEGRAGAEYLERRPEVEDHLQVHEQVGVLAATPDDSTAMIRRIAKEHR